MLAKFQKNINRDLEKFFHHSLNPNTEQLNFCKFILPEKTKENEKISVIGAYEAPPKNDWALLEGATIPDEYYYGASPKLNTTEMIRIISNLEISNRKSLDHYIDTHKEWFIYDKKIKGDQKKIRALSAYIILATAHPYGIIVEFDECQNSFPNLNISSLKIRRNNQVEIHGCPTDSVIKLFDNYSFNKTSTIGVFKAVDKHKNSDYFDFTDIYSDTDNIIFVSGKTFYSGVLPRVVQIVEESDLISNDSVSTITLKFERSTYATVHAFDNNFTDHPIMKEINEDSLEKYTYDKIIVDFFNNEDKCIEDTLNKISNDCANSFVSGDERKQNIDIVNDYLDRSTNVNQIVVAGNIITSDGYLVYCERGASEIDAGVLYPSVNGNVEIADKDVELYETSANVDYPTIDLSSYKNSFQLELCRETEAELNIFTSKNLWNCEGIALMGFNRSNNINDSSIKKSSSTYPFKKRRMHFGIIYNQNVSQKFSEIEKAQKIAVEHNESRKIFGLKLKTYKNRFEKFCAYLWKGLNFISNSRLFVTSILSITLFLISIPNNPFKFSSWISEVNTYIPLLFSFFAVILTVCDITKYFFSLKKNKTIFRYIECITKIYNTDLSYKKICEFLKPNPKQRKLRSKLFKQKPQFQNTPNYYPIFVLCLELYLTKEFMKAENKKQDKKINHYFKNSSKTKKL